MMSCIVSTLLSFKVEWHDFTYALKHSSPSAVRNLNMGTSIVVFRATFFLYHKRDREVGPFVLLIVGQILITSAFFSTSLSLSNFGFKGVLLAILLNVIRNVGLAMSFIAPFRITLECSASTNLTRFLVIQLFTESILPHSLILMFLESLKRNFADENKFVSIMTAGCLLVTFIVSLILCLSLRKEKIPKSRKSYLV